MHDRYYSLQILRAVAAWMVFFHHYMQLFHNFQFDSPLGGFFATYGGFGVDIFFVLSGFVMFFSMANRSATAYSFFVKRFFRVAPAYWFYTIAMVGFIALLPTEFSYTDYDARFLLSSLLFYPADNPSGIGMFPLLTVGWTLNFEMTFYTILALSMLVSKRGALLLCGSLIIILPSYWPNYLPYSHILTSEKLYEFVAGMALAALISSNKLDWLKRYRVSLTILTMGIGFLCFTLIELDHGFELLASACIVFSVALLNDYIDQQHPLARFLIRAGDYSYSTYLSHIFVIGVGIHLFDGEPSGGAEAALLITLSLVLYLVSKYSYTYMEQNRGLLALRQRLLMPNASARPA